MKKLFSLTLAVAFALTTTALAADDTVKVFILAGQSNMEGKAKNKLLEFQAKDAKTKKLFEHLRKGDEWIVRDDVSIKYFDKMGGLTIGYGSPDRTGMELEFGHKMGDHFDAPVLLIKTAWGGRAIGKRFRPPSAMPDAAELKAALEKAIESTKKKNVRAKEKGQKEEPLPTMDDVKAPYGENYRLMIEEVKDVQKNFATYFPKLKGKKLELTGFVWFQGWNDMCNSEYAARHKELLKVFIEDVRKDLGSPKLPVVIDVMGQNAFGEASGNMKVIQDAQLAMEKVPAFKGNVKAVRTDVLADKAAEELYPKWKDNFEKWEQTGSDFGYHYKGSAIWFNRIGDASAKAMIELLEKK